MPRACPEPSRRGGKRLGAGAPKGNLNALKHGLRSQQVRSLAMALARIPLFRAYLHRLARRRQQNLTASLAIAAWLRHQNALLNPDGRGPLPPPPPLTKSQIRLLARYIVGQTIKKDGLPPTREAAQNHFLDHTIKLLPPPVAPPPER